MNSSIVLLLRQRSRGMTPFVLLVTIAFAFFGIPAATGAQVSAFNVYDATQDFAALGLLSLALGITMIAGEFDLSVVGVYGLGGMIAVQVGAHNALVGVVAAAGAAALVGLTQGLMIAKLRLNSMAVTLGGYLAVLGLTSVLGKSKSVSYADLGVGTALDHPIATVLSIRVLVAIAVFTVAIGVMRYTVLGRNIRAIGGDRRASRTVGVRVDSLVVGCFVISACLSSLSGALLAYSLATAVPDVGLGPLIFAITATLLGGVLLGGGHGSPMGIAAGAMALALLRELFSVLAAPDYAANLVTGGLLVAVTIFSAPDLKRWWRSIRPAEPSRHGSGRSLGFAASEPAGPAGGSGT